jgi:hypothetical protein
MDLKVDPCSVRIQMHNLYVSDGVSYPDPEPNLIRILLVLWILGRKNRKKGELHEILWFEELNVLTGGLNFIEGLNSWTREEILYIAVFGQRSSFF